VAVYAGRKLSVLKRQRTNETVRLRNKVIKEYNRIL
jgi:hypothetical protein